MRTKTSDNWNFKSGTWDALKTSYIDFEDYPMIGSQITIEQQTETILCIETKKITKNSLINMFVDDYRLERYWNRIDYYANIFKAAKYVMTPDFSALVGMPEDMIKWNIYRSRLIGHVYEKYKINVIPTITWTNSESYPYICKGIKPKSTIAVSNIGARTDKAIEIFNSGLQEVIKQIEPTQIVICSNKKYKQMYENEIFYHIKPFWDGRA